MLTDVGSLNRIEKLLIDRDNLTLQEAADRLCSFHVILACGPEVAHSATFQAAVLTAANIASHCFPGRVRVHADCDAPLLIRWSRGSTFAEALIEVAGEHVLDPTKEGWESARCVTIGSTKTLRSGVQLSFDGWTCVVSPSARPVRLGEREACLLAGVAGGALAISELFLGNFGCVYEAGARAVGLSLWRPDLSWEDEAAWGVDSPLRYLPEEAWLLGLGHLGQANAWALGLLPFSSPERVDVVLQDFDRVVSANLDTGLVTYNGDEKQLKSRVVNRFLEGADCGPT